MVELDTSKEEHVKFSEIFGIRREEVVETLGESHARQLAWEYLWMYPNVSSYARLRKSRARMMVDVLRGEPCVTRGNVSIRVEQMGLTILGSALRKHINAVYVFTYRGTDILKWHPYVDWTVEVDTKEFEGTASTRNQRRMAREAIEEFRRVVLSL